MAHLLPFKRLDGEFPQKDEETVGKSKRTLLTITVLGVGTIVLTGTWTFVDGGHGIIFLEIGRCQEMQLTEGNREKIFGKVIILLGLTLLWLLPLAQLVEASDDHEPGFSYSEASEHRAAADAADLIERGEASVTESPQFPDGIRLTAWATEEDKEFEPGLASAVYYFGVPSWTHYLKITIRYRDVSKDDDIAGRLWIKTTNGDQGEVMESEEETLLYGDTFILRSDRTSEIICVPAGRHVEDGTMEMHIVASGRDSVDVNYIRVEYLKKKPTRIRVVHHTFVDYWHRWPPYWYGYHYFYWGPCYWPRTSLIYVHWVWPSTYYWHTYRPRYRICMAKYRHRHPHWYRRYSHTYHADPGHPRVRKRIPLRRSTNIRRVRTERRRQDLLPNHHASLPKVQGTRRSARAKPQPVIPRHTVTKKIRNKGREPTTMKKTGRSSQDRHPTRTTGKESQKRLQFRTVQRKSHSKSMVRESSQARSRARRVPTRAVRQQNQIRGGWARRPDVIYQSSRR